ncbi:MAG: PQQ-dependent sugar dehydrogenase [Longimicrobiales bacterium]
MTKGTTQTLLAAAAALALAAPVQAQETFRSAAHDYRVVTVADGLVHPWSIAFLPGGDMLVTERPGRLRIVRDGRLLPDPVPGIPEVHAQGQGGLLEVMPHPDFASNRMLYLTYSKPLPGGGSTTALIRGRFENDRLNAVEELFVAESEGAGHYGSRLAFDGNGHLFMSVGDRQAPPRGSVADLEAHPAQDLSSHQGVILRLTEDGGVPAGNPFIGRAGALPEIWSYGHRNPQGMVIDDQGRVWITEHGPQGGDEVNLIAPGQNYGWPVVGYGVNYRSGSAIHEGTTREGMVDPAHIWVPSIGTSGLEYYTGSAFPGWRGHLLAGGLAGAQIGLLTLRDDTIVKEETLVLGIGRVRDVRQGPDGFVYVALDERGGASTRVVRIEPVM